MVLRGNIHELQARTLHYSQRLRLVSRTCTTTSPYLSSSYKICHRDVKVYKNMFRIRAYDLKYPTFYLITSSQPQLQVQTSQLYSHRSISKSCRNEPCEEYARHGNTTFSTTKHHAEGIRGQRKRQEAEAHYFGPSWYHIHRCCSKS
jgi:hypothetical protein